MVAQGHPGPEPGQEGDASSGSAPRTPPRSCSRTAGSRSRTCSAARRSWRRSCERGRAGQEVARRRRAGDLRDHPAAGRRLGARHRPGRLRVDPRVPRRPLRGRHAAAADAAHPADAGRRRDRDRSGAAAGPARRLDGPQRRPDDRRPGLDVEAQGRRRDDVGDDDADGPGRPLRLEHRAARWRSSSATPRSTSCSRARPRSSGWSSRACRRANTPSGSATAPKSPSRRWRWSRREGAGPGLSSGAVHGL